MAANPFKSGTDTYKFFEALSPFAQQEMLKNPYALNTAWATLQYGGGLDAALKNPEQIIYMTPSGLDISPTSYAAYDARHPSVGPRELDMSFSDFLLNAAALVATPFIPGIASGLGAAIAPAANTAVQTAIGNAIVQGTLAEAQGGDFLKGAALSGANSALGGYVRPELVEATGSNALANALTSGTMAELSGGEFLQGAIQGGISGATQDAKLALADKYLNAVEPGTGYNPATSPTELDVIQAFPELAPPPENLTQGVTDILNYAANTPSVQLAAGPNYVGEFSGMPYDPNYTSDAGTGAYRVEVSGQPTQSGWSDFQWENQNPEEYLDSLEPGVGYDDLTSPTEQDVLAAFPELTPNVADAFPLLFQNNQGLPIPAEVFNPPQSVQDVVNTISADVSVANPSLTADEVRSIVEGSISNLPPGLSAEDVRKIVTDSLTNLPAAPTQQDIINIISGQNFATPEDVQSAINSINIPQGLSEQDVQSIVSNALANNPGLNASDVQSIVNSAVSQIPAGLTAQDVTNILGQQNFATPQDIQTAINSINIPQGLSEQDVQSIVSNAFANNPGLTTNDVQSIVNSAVSQIPAGLTAQDVTSILGQQNFATPDDIRTAISGIQFPAGMTPQDVQSIVSQAFQNNPGINATDVQEIVQGALNNLPPGLSSDDVRNIVTDAVSNIPAAPTEQDIINIIGGQGLATGQDLGNLANQLGLTQQELFNQIGQIEQGFGQQVTNLESQLTQQGRDLMSAFESQGMDYRTALDEAIRTQGQQFGSSINDIVSQIGNVQTGLETQLNQQGRDFMDYLQQQGFDYETSLTEALEAQKNEFGTALNQTTEDLLKELSSTGTGLQTQFETGLQGLADQLGITQQELINQLNQTQESFGSELSNLQTQLTDFDTTNAERYADLIKTVGLVGTGLGALQSTFNLFKDQNTPKQFEVVAPPSEWTSPVYGTPTTTPVPFTPSAPIDFGSPNLLQGTQFARPAAQPFQMPYDLSNMVNTLNFQSVPFVQQQMPPSFTGVASQPTPGFSNIIGNLNGSPVSIADIISNIQGQYGQKAAS